MHPTNEVLEQNRALAEQINREARNNPTSQYAGKYVGFANGKVVAVADTLSETLGVLEQLEPDWTRRYCIEASRDYSEVEFIWETH